MVNIIHGPDEEIFSKISKNQRIVFELENRVTQQVIITCIKMTGDNSFTFTTEAGGHGLYNVKKRKGTIDYPAIVFPLSETAPKSGVQSS